MTVSKADRIKAIERVMRLANIHSGDTPSPKRKRGIYRALERDDSALYDLYNKELKYIIDMRTAIAHFLYSGQENAVNYFSKRNEPGT